MIASSRGPSGEAASSTAWTTNQVTTAAPNAHAAPSDDRAAAALFAPRKLAVTAAKISTASSPSRKTMIAELETTVARLCGAVTSVGSTGPGARGRHQVDEAGDARQDGHPQGHPPVGRRTATPREMCCSTLTVREP